MSFVARMARARHDVSKSIYFCSAASGHFQNDGYLRVESLVTTVNIMASINSERARRFLSSFFFLLSRLGLKASVKASAL